MGDLNRKVYITEEKRECEVRKLEDEITEEKSRTDKEKEKLEKLKNDKQGVEREVLKHKESIKSLQEEYERVKEDNANLDKGQCFLQKENEHLKLEASKSKKINQIEISKLKAKIDDERRMKSTEIVKNIKLDTLNQWLINEMKKYKDRNEILEGEIEAVKLNQNIFHDEKSLLHQEICQLKDAATKCEENKEIELDEIKTKLNEVINRRMEGEIVIKKFKDQIEALQNETVKLREEKITVSDDVIKENVNDQRTPVGLDETKYGDSSSPKLSKLEKRKRKLISDLEEKILDYNNDRTCKNCRDRINCENCWKYINKFHQVFYSYCAEKYAEKLKISIEEAQNIFLTTNIKTISRLL